MKSPPIAATMVDAPALAEELARFRVLSRERLEELFADFPGGGATRLAEFLVARRELTPYQAERTLSGQAKSLVLGPYRLLEPHHVGAFGPIFRAAKGKQEFAIRVLPLRSLWQAKQAKQLVRTLAALADNPAIVPLVDADSANGFHYLVWPLASGVLLADRVQPWIPLPPATASAMLAFLAAALAECHARHVVHGLLTPHTIALDSKGLPRLLEFGAGMLLARNLAVEDSLFDTMSASLAVAGAFDYAAPEWVADPANPTPAADQYSLGAVGFFALTGAPPSLDALGQLAQLNDELPAGLAGAIARLLQPDPAARFSGMDEARETLLGLAGLTERAVSDSVVPSEVQPRQSERPDAARAQEGAWTAPLPRHAKRDNTEESIGFDLPDDPVEEVVTAVAKIAPATAIRPKTVDARAAYEDAPLPTARASPTLPENPVAPPRESRLLGSTKKGYTIAAPPELPAAPLPPITAESRPSGNWSTVPAKSGPTTREAERPSGSVLWKKMKRKVLFWQTAGDTVQVSVFGPEEVTHTQTPKLTVFLHSPSVMESVGTLARAFHHDAILLGTGSMAQELTRGSCLDVHVGVAHISVSNPLCSLTWQGQPQRLTFDLVVPWEAPVGTAGGIVSIGRDEVRIGKVEFEIPILLAGKG